MVSTHTNLHFSLASSKTETLSLVFVCLVLVFFPSFFHNPFSRLSCALGTGKEKCDRRVGVLLAAKCSKEREASLARGGVGVTALGLWGGRSREETEVAQCGWNRQKGWWKSRRGRTAHLQKIPLRSPVSAVKSHPCCLSFPSCQSKMNM